MRTRKRDKAEETLGHCIAGIGRCWLSRKSPGKSEKKKKIDRERERERERERGGGRQSVEEREREREREKERDAIQKLSGTNLL